jgi:hypothetical protein
LFVLGPSSTRRRRASGLPRISSYSLFESPARLKKRNAPGRITGSVSTKCAQEVDYSKVAPDATETCPRTRVHRDNGRACRGAIGQRKRRGREAVFCGVSPDQT